VNSIVKLFAFFNGETSVGSSKYPIVTVLSELGDFLLEHAVEKKADGPTFAGVAPADVHHDIYREYAPDGFEVIWKDSQKDAEVTAAYARHLAKASADGLQPNLLKKPSLWRGFVDGLGSIGDGMAEIAGRVLYQGPR
jgi:hypothetical protein